MYLFEYAANLTALVKHLKIKNMQLFNRE